MSTNENIFRQNEQSQIYNKRSQQTGGMQIYQTRKSELNKRH